MRFKLHFTIYLALLGMIFTAGASLAQSRVDYDYAYIGDPLPDPLMQQNKETYVLYGCAYCHGIDLAPVGEAADLRTSPLVAADVDANVLGPILRNGIPQTPKSSPMPQFSDLSEREIKAISSFIHYARAEERYKTLIAMPTDNGNAAEGKKAFERNCASCHATDGDLSKIGEKHEGIMLRKQMLKPAGLQAVQSYKLEALNNEKIMTGRYEHQVLLENFEEPDVANIIAFLRSQK